MEAVAAGAPVQMPPDFGRFGLSDFGLKMSSFHNNRVRHALKFSVSTPTLNRMIEQKPETTNKDTDRRPPRDDAERRLLVETRRRLRDLPPGTTTPFNPIASHCE